MVKNHAGCKTRTTSGGYTAVVDIFGVTMVVLCKTLDPIQQHREGHTLAVAPLLEKARQCQNSFSRWGRFLDPAADGLGFGNGVIVNDFAARGRGMTNGSLFKR